MNVEIAILKFKFHFYRLFLIFVNLPLDRCFTLKQLVIVKLDPRDENSVTETVSNCCFVMLLSK